MQQQRSRRRGGRGLQEAAVGAALRSARSAKERSCSMRRPRRGDGDFKPAHRPALAFEPGVGGDGPLAGRLIEAVANAHASTDFSLERVGAS